MADTIKLPPGYEDYVPAPASNVKLPPGYENYVKDTTEAGIEHPAFANAGIYDKPEGPDLFRHYLGNPISHALPSIGATIGGLAGEGIASVPLAAAAGGLGSSLGNKLRQISPRLFGQPSDSPGTDSIVDAVLQGAAPEAGGLALKNAPGLLARVASKFPAGRDFTNNQTMASIYDKAIGYLKPSEPVVPRIQTEPFPGEQRVTTEDRFANSQNNRNMVNQGFEPNTHPSNMMVKDANREAVKAAEAENARLATHTEQLTTLFNKGLSPSAKTFDASKVIDELAKNPKAYEGLDPTARKGIETFLQTANATKPLSKLGDQSVMKYDGKRLIIYGLGAAGGFASGHTAEGLAAGAAANYGLTITNDVLAKKLANPEFAALFTNALKTPLTAPQSSLVGKALMFALRGSEVYALTPDDKPVKAYVNEKGDLTYATRP